MFWTNEGSLRCLYVLPGGLSMSFFSPLCDHISEILSCWLEVKGEGRVLLFFSMVLRFLLCTSLNPHQFVMSLYDVSTNHQLELKSLGSRKLHPSVCALSRQTQKHDTWKSSPFAGYWWNAPWLRPVRNVFLGHHSYELISYINLTFWWELEGMPPAERTHGRPRSRLRIVGLSTTTEDTLNSHGL